MEHYTRMKHVATALAECAMDTGYSYEFLAERFEENRRDGMSIDEAVNDVITTAKELDY